MYVSACKGIKCSTFVKDVYKFTSCNSNNVIPIILGKHPVSALAELCTKKRWKTPTYNIAHESGPAHKKDFLYQVVVNGNSYQHNIASNNKKLAKAEAAFVALKALGVVPADAAMAL